MYINPFWAGVLTTVLVEILILFSWAAVYAGKNRKK